MTASTFQSSTHRFFRLYLMMLSSIALLTIIGHLFVQKTLDRHLADNRVIELATRQQLLSEQLGKTALIIQYTTNEDTRSTYIEEFRTLFDLLEHSQNTLQLVDSESDLIENKSIHIIKLFADLQQRYWSMGTVMKDFLAAVDQGPFHSAFSADVSSSVSQFIVEQIAFAQGMNVIVTQYKIEADKRLSRLRIIDFIWSGLVWLVLLAEVIYVFQPTLQSFEQNLQEGVNTKKLLQKKDAWLQGILDHVPLLISFKDAQGRYLVINRLWEKLLRVSTTEAKGKSDYEFFHTELATLLRAHDNKTLRTKTLLEFDEVIPQIDGLHIYNSLKFPLCEGSQEPYAICTIATDLTTYQQLEQSLQECEALVKIWFNSNRQVVWIMDRDGVILRANQAAADWLEVSLPQLLGQCIYHLFTADTVEEKKLVIAEAIDTHQPVRFEEVRKNRCLVNWIYPMVTPHKQSIKLAVVSENYFTGTVSLTHSAAAFTDTLAKIPNDHRQEIATTILTSPAVVTEELSPILSSKLEQSSSSSEFRMLTRDGKVLWLRDDLSSPAAPEVFPQVSVPQISPNSTPNSTPGVHSVALLTPLQQLQERVVTSLYEGIVIADAQLPDMPLIYVNPAFEKLTGYSKTEILGRNCRILHEMESGQPALDEVRVALREGKNCRVILRNYRKDGRLFWNQLSISPLYDAAGKLTHFVGIQNDITAQKFAEEALRISEERYRRMVDTAQEGIWLFDATAKITFVNQRLADMLGYRVEEVLGHSFFEFMETTTIQDLQQWLASGPYCTIPEVQYTTPGVQDVALTNEKYDCCLRHKEGTVLWAIISLSQIRDEQGQFIGALGMMIDITQRKQTEAALQESENKFRSLTEQMAAAIIIYQGEQIIYVNSAVVAMTGYTSVELLEMKFWEFVHPEFQTLVKERGLARQRGEILPSRYEIKFLTKTGEARWLDLTAYVIEYQGKTAVLITAFDVTERKQAEQILRNIVEGVSARTGENFLKSLVEHLVTTLQVKYAFIGKLLDNDPYKLLTLFVVTADQLLENFEYDLHDTPCEKLISGETPCCSYTREVQKLFANNSLLVSLGVESCVGTPLFNTEGQVVGLMAIMDDKPLQQATLVESMLQIFAARASAELERLRALETLEQERALLAIRVQERTAELTAANAGLARAARLKDEFLANMRHELRTPLGTIISYSEALQDPQIYGGLTDQQLSIIHTMEDHGRRLLELIDDILDLTKIEAGKLKLKILPLSLQVISNACVRLMKSLAIKKQIQFTVTVEEQLISSQLAADEFYLIKILSNLLSNAIKFTAPGGTVKLSISGRRDQEVVYFHITDNGKGIAQADMINLFKPFEPLEGGLAKQQAGVGMGLCLVYRLTEMHGGSVSVVSEVDKGSQFTVALPWPQNQPEEIKNLPKMKALRQVTVLLAEDNPLSFEQLTVSLEIHGYSVILARNGIQAVEKAKEYLPGLILLDLQMPVMDGFKALQQIRADDKLAKVPLIVCTSLSGGGDRERCLTAGADEYLSKPVSFYELQRVMTGLLMG